MSISLFIPQEILRTQAAQLHGKKIFITGGTGFFGQSLLSVLGTITERFGSKIDCTVLSRDPIDFKRATANINFPPNLRHVQGDVNDFAFCDDPFDHILHFAPTRDPQRILEFARHCGAKSFLMTSSGAAYGVQPQNLQSIDESFVGSDYTSASLAKYAQAKKGAEELGCKFAKQAGFAHLIARCFAFVGPHLNPNSNYAIANLIRDAVLGSPMVIAGDGSAIRSYLYADDLIVWLLNILLSGQAGRVYNVGSNEPVSIGDLARRIQSALGVHLRILKNNEPNQSAGRYVPSIERAKLELGLDVWTPLDAAIAATAAQYRVRLS